MTKRMRRPDRLRSRLQFALLILTASPYAVAQTKTSDSIASEKAVDSKVVSVALFKNGLAIIKRQVPLQGAGVYRIEDVPEPVHGTFLIESNGPLEARVENRKSPFKNQPALGSNLQDELAGLKVTINGRTAKTPVIGTVMAMPKPEIDTGSPANMSRAVSLPAYNPVASRFLLVKTDKGISYVDLGDIVSLEAEGNPQPKEPIMENKPVLLFDAKAPGIGNSAMISYLSHGLAWAPSYKVDLTDAKRLKIEQNASIRNELLDLSETEISVISGYPSVQFGQVVSPLASSQTWMSFFQQLGNRGSVNAFNNSFVTQNAAYNQSNNSVGSGLSAAANNGDTIDLYYHSIGKRSLKKGDALTLTTGSAQVDYERIVEWTIPDNRDEWGRPNNNQRVDPATGQGLQDDVWDALKFKNALPFPMTSAPAMVITDGKFSGQGQVLWTNRNEEATLRVNKALSIRARHVEYENQVGDPGKSERDLVYLGGRRLRKVTVNGELRLCNNRPSETKMIVKRQFSGDYVKGDDTPKIDLREEGVWTVNKRNELTWTLNLKPAEERTVKFQYMVLVDF